MIDHFTLPLEQRERAARRAQGPSYTFLCPGCDQSRYIVGRRRVLTDGQRRVHHCAQCVADAHLAVAVLEAA